MNIKSLAMIGAVSVGFASLAGAQVVYMTGSTALRNIAYATLVSSSGVFDSAPNYTLYEGTSNPGANYMTFSNTIAGVPTVVKCHWSGSEAGIQDIQTPAQETFLNDSVTLDNTLHTGSPTSAQTVTNDPGQIDVAMADTTRAFSKNPGGTAKEYFVGVVPFTWVKGSNTLAAAANLVNVTDAEARKVLQGGQKLALFTGNSADTNNYVYVSGRNSGSGTRVNQFGITGFGIRTSPFQIELDGSGNMINLDGLGTYAGDFGFESGGTLAGTLGVDTASSADMVHVGKTGFVTIALMGRSDANKAIGLGATELTYNGYSYSSNNIVEGKFTFWGNETAQLRQPAFAPQAAAVFSKLTNDVTGVNSFCDGVSAFNKITMMRATRTGPTTDPTHK